MDDTLKLISDLMERVDKLEQARIHQSSIPNGTIKQRHMGEANTFIRGGATAGKPTTGEPSQNGLAVYYDITAKKLYIYDGTAWRYAAFT